jgi:hypothetical protein
LAQTLKLAKRRLRANPRLELVSIADLTVSEKRALGDAADDPANYGVLRTRNAASDVRCVSHDAAELFLSLTTIASLPQYAVRTLGEETDRFVRRMVLDGILEIEVGDKMLGGPAALEALGAGDPNPAGTLAKLSVSALEYAASLAIADAGVLLLRLYDYNRVPASPRWRRLLPDAAAVGRYLGIDASVEQGRRWLTWQRVERLRPHAAGIVYKLYVSPDCAALPGALRDANDVVRTSRAFQWKVGSDAFGLLRPDKFVAYFYDFAHLLETATTLSEKLLRCPPHGVPFTAELAENGLLSWGVDLPIANDGFRRWSGNSWRQAICARLAAALIRAQSAEMPPASSVRFALERLRQDGVDPDTWRPLGNLAWA